MCSFAVLVQPAAVFNVLFLLRVAHGEVHAVFLIGAEVLNAHLLANRNLVLYLFGAHLIQL